MTSSNIVFPGHDDQRSGNIYLDKAGQIEASSRTIANSHASFTRISHGKIRKILNSESQTDLNQCTIGGDVTVLRSSNAA